MLRQIQSMIIPNNGTMEIECQEIECQSNESNNVTFGRLLRKSEIKAQVEPSQKEGYSRATSTRSQCPKYHEMDSRVNIAMVQQLATTIYLCRARNPVLERALSVSLVVSLDPIKSFRLSLGFGKFPCRRIVINEVV